MLAKILFCSDLHKRDVDPSTIKGYCDATERIQWDIINYIKANGVTHFVSLGDWYDKGYRSTAKSISDVNMDRKIAEAVNGNAYICLGNHRYIELGENPENFICQPSDCVTSPVKVFSEEPVFKAVRSLRIGDVQLSFFHFDRDSKDYVNSVEPGVSTHIGIYHDDVCVPANIKAKSGFIGETSSTYLNRIYSNVDVAIHGHLHVGIAPKRERLMSGKDIMMFVPGAMICTMNKDSYKMPCVKLPILIINDDSSVTYKVVEFNTYVSELQFSSARERLQEKAETKAKLFDQGAPSVIAQRSAGELLSTSVVEYLRQRGYTEGVIDVYRNATPGNLSMNKVCALLLKGEGKL